jgi:ABC-type branched-subunit amino acid transport system substrate-binding protein
MGGDGAPSVRAALAPYCASSANDMLQECDIAALQWLNLNPSIKKVAIIYYPMDVFPFDTEMPQALSTIGVSSVTIPITFTQLDFATVVTQAVAAGCQGYINAGMPSVQVALARDLFDRGITQGVELLGGDSTDDPSLFTVGKGYLENSYIVDPGNPLDTSTRYQALVAAYEKDNGGAKPSVSVLAYYDSVYALKYAIEDLGITGDPNKLAIERSDIAGYLYNSPVFQGLQGSFQFVNGQRLASAFLLQIENNQFTLLSEIKLPALNAP